MAPVQNYGAAGNSAETLLEQSLQQNGGGSEPSRSSRPDEMSESLPHEEKESEHTKIWPIQLGTS